MATEFVTTKPNSDSITLSVNTNGMKASTSISLNGMLLKSLDDSFTDFYIGTNQGLNGNTLTVTTYISRYPSIASTSQVDFMLNGAASVSPDNPHVSSEPFPANAPVVPHFMTYYFM